jgi:hypothetical protein
MLLPAGALQPVAAADACNLRVEGNNQRLALVVGNDRPVGRVSPKGVTRHLPAGIDDQDREGGLDASLPGFSLAAVLTIRSCRVE